MAKKALKVTIIKKSGDKSLIGEHIILKKHDVYPKYIKIRRKYMVHDENNSHKVGDIVYIKEHKPISKRKNWIIVEENKTKQEVK
jgi:small subunit ribosomal protein S17